MDNLIEDEEILKIGRKTFDISNVAAGRKKISRRIWDKMVKDYNEELESDKNDIEVHAKYRDIINDIYNQQGIYLIRQSFIVLNRRYGFIASCKEILKRQLLTTRYIDSFSDEELEPFREWAHLNITGVKKKDLEMFSEIQKLEIKLLESAKEKNISPEQLMDALPILLDGMVGHTNTQTHTQKM